MTAAQRRVRARVNTHVERPPRATEVDTAVAVVDASGVVPVLCDRLDASTGRPRSLSIKALLVAMVLNAMPEGHDAMIKLIAGQLNALSGQRRRELGIRDWDPEQAYSRVDRLFNKLVAALESNWQATLDGHTVTVDANWVAGRLARAGADPTLATSGSVAIDGTAMPTRARMRFGDDDLDFDGHPDVVEAAEHTGSLNDDAPRKVKVLGIGADGRRQYTADPDARGGYRTATDRQPGGRYVGYEPHLAIQIRTIASTNGVDQIALGGDVPGYVLAFSLAPAGSHRGKAMTPAILDANADGAGIDEVLMDPGYSLGKPQHCLLPLRQAGIDPVFKPVSHQIRRSVVDDHFVLVNGQLYSRHLPAELGGEGGPDKMPLPAPHPPAELREASDLLCNQRARFRATPHSRPDADGYARYKCPFCAGLVHNRALRRRANRRSAVTVALRDHAETCCQGTTTFSPETLALTQRIPAGTTAWWGSYGRRNLVETANSILKDHFVNIEDRRFIHVFGLAKTAVLLGATLAGHNLRATREFKRRQQAIADDARRRAPRRRKTYRDLGVAPATPAAVTDDVEPPGDPPG